MKALQEYKSKLNLPAPLFKGLIAAAIVKKGLIQEKTLEIITT